MRIVPRVAGRAGAASVLVALTFAAGLSGGPGLTALAPVCAGAASQHHATVIVTHLSSQPLRRVCVGFAEEHISGSDLLNRSQVQWQSDAYQGQGTAVCQVDYEPQTSPQDSCLGHDNDPYWSIWTATYTGGWTYAQRAITALTIHDGDALGLRYQKPDGAHPPDAPGDLCPPPAPPATATPATGGSQSAAVATSAPARTGTGGAPSLAGPSATAQAGAGTTSPPDPTQALTPAPSTGAVVAETPRTSSSIAGIGGRPASWLGPAAAGVAGLILVGALLAQVVLPRLRQ